MLWYLKFFGPKPVLMKTMGFLKFLNSGCFKDVPSQLVLVWAKGRQLSVSERAPLLCLTFRAVGTFWNLVFRSHFSLLLHTWPGQASSSLCVPQYSEPTKHIWAPQGPCNGSVAQASGSKLLFSFWSIGTPVFFKMISYTDSILLHYIKPALILL